MLYSDPNAFYSPAEGQVGDTFYADRDNGDRLHKGADVYGDPGTPVNGIRDMQLVAAGQGGTGLADNDYWAHFRDLRSNHIYRYSHVGPEVMDMQPNQVVKGGEAFSTIGNVVGRPHVDLKVQDDQGNYIDWPGAYGLVKGATAGKVLGPHSEIFQPEGQATPKNLFEQAKTFTPDDLRSMALDVAGHYDIPRDLFLGLLSVESSWKATAKSPESSATGLAQFTDGTGKTYFKDQGQVSANGQDPNDPRWHPGYSMDAAARYLTDLYRETGDWQQAVKRYYGAKDPSANDKYLNQVKAAAVNESKEVELHGKFPMATEMGDNFGPAAGVNTLGNISDVPGVQQAGQGAGFVYQKIRDMLGLNEPEPDMDMLAQGPGMAPLGTEGEPPLPEGVISDPLWGQMRLPGAAEAVSKEDLARLDTRPKLPGMDRDLLENETYRVMGRFVDGYTLGVSELAKQEVFGSNLAPKTPLGMVAGEAAYLGGQIAGPFKWMKLLTGTYVFPSLTGLRTSAQILGASMKEGAVNLGLLQGLSRVIPALIEHPEADKFAQDIVNSTKSGALVGATFPLLSIVPGQGVIGTGLRMATGLAAMDVMRAWPQGKWTTAGNFYDAYQKWDPESQKQFAMLSYQYLMDLYFARTVPAIRATMAAHNQSVILDEIAKLNPQDLEKFILGVTGQDTAQEGLKTEAPGKTIPTPATVREINPDAATDIELPKDQGAEAAPAAEPTPRTGLDPDEQVQLTMDKLDRLDKKIGRARSEKTKDQLAIARQSLVEDLDYWQEQKDKAAAAAPLAEIPPGQAEGPTAEAGQPVAGPGEPRVTEDQKIALGNLTKELFGEVQAGRLPVDQGAIIGQELGGNDFAQEALADKIAEIKQRGEQLTPEKLQEIIQEVKGGAGGEEAKTPPAGGETAPQPRVYEKNGWWYVDRPDGTTVANKFSNQEQAQKIADNIIRYGPEASQEKKLYAGLPGPETGEILGSLRETGREIKRRFAEVGTSLRELFSPGSMPDAKEVAMGLVKMMGRKNEEINQAHYKLMDFRDLFRDTTVAEWTRLASTWQAGGRTGSPLDAAYDAYHEITDSLMPRIRMFKDLAYQDNYLRQAWKNSRDPGFLQNLNAFRAGRTFKNYSDLDDLGRPRPYKATFDEDGRYTLERIGGPEGEAAPGAAAEAGAAAGEEAAPGGPQGRSFSGGSGYFQHKTIPDYSTGLMLGGKPKFENLFDLMMYDIGQKTQFIYGNDFIMWARKVGYLKYFPRGKIPADWEAINDPRGLIRYAYLKEIEEPMSFEKVPDSYDMTGRPQYDQRVMDLVMVAPRGAARVINNWLSPGLHGNPLYDLYRDAIDPLRKLGVSFSTYHLRFTMNNSLATGAGQALSKAMGDMFAGDFGALAGDVKSGALNAVGAGFVRQLMEGRQLTHAQYEGTDDPMMQGTLRRFIDTGGTLPSPEAMLPMIRTTTQGIWRSLVQLARLHPIKGILGEGGLIDATSRPIMIYMVPFAKLGAFAVLDRALAAKLDAKYEGMTGDPHELAQAKEDEYTRGLHEVNSHLDNIYGQMNYDALLLNRCIKDLLFFAVKFPGWNIGSGRWLASMVMGVKHGLTPGQEASEREKESLRMGLGMVLNMGIYSSMLYWLINGKPPDNPLELYTKGVWTGGYTPGGSPEYIRDATYWRDLWGMVPIDQTGSLALGKPLDTITAKAADIWRIPTEVFGNKEAYTNNQIFTPGAGLGQLAQEAAMYGGKQFVPYSFRGMQQAHSPWGQYGSFIGWTPTPARLTDTPAQKELRSFRNAEAPQLVTTEKQAGREVKRDVMDYAYQGDGEGFLNAIREARAKGDLTSTQYRNLVLDGREILTDPHYGPLRNTFRKLNDLGEAIKVFSLANPDEREALGPLMQKKWNNAQPDTRRKYREEFFDLKEKIAQGQ